MATQITLTEASVAASLTSLQAQGFDLDLLTACSDSDIDRLAPELLTPLQALKLKIALRQKRSEQFNESLYKRLLCCVGLVDVYFKDGSNQLGNAVLIGEQGFALTALHILTQEDDGEQESSRKGKACLEAGSDALSRSDVPSSIKGKTSRKAGNDAPSYNKGKVLKREVQSRRKREVQDIQVSFPNTREGLLQYKAVVVHLSTTDDDLALLRAADALPPQFQTIHTLRSWPPYQLQEADKVFLLSFPAGKGEQVRISHNPSGGEDLPWYAQGAVTCVDTAKGQAFADYSSFGGASGALVVHPLPKEGSYKAFIHLGTYHESEVLPKWNQSELDNLNMSLGQKAYNGYFSLKVGAFIDSYFQPDGAGGKVLPKYLHHQVVVRRVKKTPKEKKDEAVEELDLFGPWPGLDDNVDA